MAKKKLTPEELEQAKAARREYFREYRRKNRDKLNAYRRDYMQNHPGKRAEYNNTYWDNVAARLKREREKLGY